MNAAALFAVGTLLTWFGYAAALRTAAQAVRGQLSSAGIWAIAAGILLFAGSQITKGSSLDVPLIWPVMPFAAWAVLVSVCASIGRAIQALGSLNPQEKNARIRQVLVWVAACAAFIAWFRLVPDAKIEILKGAIPLSPPAGLALVFLAIGSLVAMVVTARAARTRALAKGFATHLALLVGSVIFALPLAWLVITSFKEDIDMSSPNGIVWIPRVTETVPYLSPTDPHYATRFEGEDVQGTIMERRPDGSVKLDIDRPMSMRGITVETRFAALTQVPIDVPLVTVRMDGKPTSGKVVEQLADGHMRVEAPNGRQQVYAPADVTPVRKVGLRLQNYPDALDYLPPEAKRGVTYVQNTLIIVVLTLIGTVLSSSLVAYAFSRMRFPGRDALFTVLLSTMMLPAAVTKLPQFMIFREIGWIDTLYPLWVPAFCGSAFNIFMLRQFFRQIPVELEDAAKIDGAGYLGTFWRVMMPQIKPAIAVIAILTFVGTWNDFLNPLIYINSPEKMTISYAVQLYASDRINEPGLLTAFTTMSIIPVILLFFFAQRYFIEGVTLTGMGGR